MDNKIINNSSELDSAEIPSPPIKIERLQMIGGLDRDEFFTAQQNVPIPVAYLGPDFKVIMVNQPFAEAFGRPRETLIGQNYFRLFPDKDVETASRHVLANGQAGSFHDRPVVFTDQPERGVTYWDGTLSPVKSARGELEGFLLSVAETTQKVRATDVLHKTSEGLEGEIKRRTEALGRANIELAGEVQRRVAAEAELRSLSRRLVQLQEDERRRISQELHDEVGQNLTMLKMILDTGLRHPGAMTKDMVKNASDQVNRVIAQVRNISMSLHPSMLEVLGLEPALHAVFERLHAESGLAIEFHSDIDNTRLDRETRLCVYRIVQEALSNVLRYAGVKRASVTLTKFNERLALSITDDGRGFDYSTLTPGQSNGISGMRERVFTLGGDFHLETGMGKGTSIDIDLPFEQPSQV